MLIDFGQVITAEAKAAAEAEAARATEKVAAAAYLAATDWLEVFAANGGEPIPEAVQRAREAARERVRS